MSSGLSVSGPNALLALRGLGLFETIRARSEEPEVFRAPKFTSGHGSHEVVYDVRHLYVVLLIS